MAVDKVKDILEKAYTITIATGDSSKVLHIERIDRPKLIRYRVTAEVEFRKQKMEKTFDVDIDKKGSFSNEADLKKTGINIALYRPGLRIYPPDSGYITGISLSNEKDRSKGIYIGKESDSISFGADKYVFSEFVKAVVENDVNNPAFQAFKDFVIPQAAIDKIRLITDSDRPTISDKLTDKDTLKMIVDILDEKYTKDDVVTPYDIHLFDYVRGVQWEITANYMQIRAEIARNLKYTGSVSAAPVKKVINRFIIGNMSQIKMLQSTVDTNALSMISQSKKTIFVDPKQGYAKMAVNSPYMYGLLDPLRSKEGAEINITNEMSLGTEITDDDVMTVKVFDRDFKELQVSAKRYLESAVLSYENIDYKTQTIHKNDKGLYKYILRGRYRETKDLNDIDYLRHPLSLLSASTAVSPMVNRTDAVRSLYAAHFNTQAIPTVTSKPNIIYTPYTKALFDLSAANVKAGVEGEIVDISENHDIVKIKLPGRKEKYKFVEVEKFNETKNHTYNIYEPTVKVGDAVNKNTPIFALNSFKDRELALSTPLLTAYTTYYNRELNDGYVLSESAAAKFLHKEVQNVEITLAKDKYSIDFSKNKIPFIGERIPDEGTFFSYTAMKDNTTNLLEELGISGLVKKTQEIKTPKDSVNAVVSNIKIMVNPTLDPKTEGYEDMMKWRNSILEPKRKFLANPLFENTFPSDEIYADVDYIIQISVEYYNKLKLSDKLTNSASSKGVVVEIVPDNQMLRTEDGQIIEVIQPPMNMGTRKNLFSVLEAQLTMLSRKLYQRFKANDINGIEDIVDTLFAEIPKLERTPSNILAKRAQDGFIRIEVSPFDTSISPELIEEYMSRLGIPNGGRVTLIDGKSGRKIRTPILVGYNSYLRLHFLSEEKSKFTPSAVMNKESVLDGASFRRVGQKIGELEAHALLSNAGADFLVKATAASQDEKGTYINAETEKLLMKMVSD